MLEKESKYVLKQSAYFMGLVLLAPLLILLVTFSFKGAPLSFKEAFFGTWHFGLLIFSVFMGISAFSNDVKSGGMEYLLTLPYSRFELLGHKVLPRLLAVTMVLALYGILSGAVGLTPAAMTTIPILKLSSLVFFCISLLVIGFTFSVYRGSVVLSALAAAAVFTLYLAVIHLMPPLAQTFGTGYFFETVSLLDGFFGAPAYMYFTVFGLLTAFVAAFVYAFKTFDLKPSKAFPKRHLKVFVPIAVVVIAVSFGWALSTMEKPWKQYFLTSSHQLLEQSYTNMRVYDRENVTELKNVYFHTPFIMEKNSRLYTHIYGTKIRDKRFIRMNLDNSKMDVLYTPPAQNTLGFRAYMYKDSFAFYEQEPAGQTFLNVVNGVTKAVDKIPVPSLVKKKSVSPMLIGAGETGDKPFWLQYTGYTRKWSVYKISGDGQVLDLGKTDIQPLFLNQLLITGHNGTLTFRKITAEGIETVKELTVPQDLNLFTRYSTDLEQLPSTEIYGGSRYNDNYFQYKKVYRLDLETLELNEVLQMENYSGYFKYIHPGKWYFVAFDSKTSAEDKNRVKSLNLLNNGSMELIKEFEPFEYWVPGNFIGIFSTGAIIVRDGKLNAYTLPGFTPITFEKLK